MIDQELFDIVDENNNLTGITKPRDLVHKEMKDWHRATGVWIVNNKKQFLCQQRSLKKDVDAGKWQSFFGGHLKAGETFEQNVIIELEEELGLHAEKENLIKAQMIKSESYLHFSQQYIYIWSGDISELKFNDGEVEQIRWMSVEEYTNLMKNEGWDNFKFNAQILEFVDSLLLKGSET
jgi:isopentenyldiphosphate isomerase